VISPLSLLASRARYRFGVKWDEPQELESMKCEENGKCVHIWLSSSDTAGDNKLLGWNKKERLTRRFAEGFVAGITVIKSTGLRPTA
jgi:hypothetical protein